MSNARYEWHSFVFVYRLFNVCAVCVYTAQVTLASRDLRPFPQSTAPVRFTNACMHAFTVCPRGNIKIQYGACRSSGRQVLLFLFFWLFHWNMYHSCTENTFISTGKGSGGFRLRSVDRALQQEQEMWTLPLSNWRLALTFKNCMKNIYFFLLAQASVV